MNFKYYIVEKDRFISKMKVRSRCRNLKEATICREIYKEQNPNIDYIILKELEVEE